MARLRDSRPTSLPVAQQPRNPQSESIARKPYNTLHQTGKTAPHRPEPRGSRQPPEELRLTMGRALLTAVSLLLLTTTAADQHFTAARENMIHTIQALAKTVPLPSASGEIDQSVLNAMREVPRHE